MSDILSLEGVYSTTRLLTREKPSISNGIGDTFDTVLFLPQKQERKGEGGLRTKGYFKTSFENKPLLSIVTVVYNGKKHLDQTIQSVINQRYDNVEYIIIDGGSSDGTLEVIKNYEEAIDYWISEPDGGISDAFNKGIALCTGKYVMLLNAGDSLNDKDALIKAVAFLSHPVVAFQARTDTGNIFPTYSKEYTTIAPSNPIMALQESMIAHQACFVEISVYKCYGRYDEGYKLRMDLDFFMRIERFIAIRCITIPLIIYDTTGLSSSLKNRLRFKIEEKKILDKYYRLMWFDILFYLSLPGYLVRKALSTLYYQWKSR